MTKPIRKPPGKSMIKRVVTAGPLVIETIYPAATPRDSPRVRQGKRAVSSPARQRMNFKCAWQRLKLLIAANFGTGDLFATLTYAGEALPDSRSQAVRDLRAFLARLRRAREGDLRYIYAIEHRHGQGRWHIHILINATGNDYGLVRSLWQKGGVEFEKIRVDAEKNYETLARYLCKEGREKPGGRLWSCSLNLRKPERDFLRVPGDTVLRPPPKREKALVLFQERNENHYGRYCYLEYVRTNQLPRPPKSGRRRKTKRPFS